MFTNARGIKSKIHSLNEYLERVKPDIFSINESHLIGKCSVEIPNYEIITKNRSTKGGGILIGISKTSGIKYSVTKMEEDSEQLWIKCNDKKWSWRIGTVYGLQESQVTEEETERWFYNLEREISNCSDEPMLIIGDTNAHVGNDEDGIKGNLDKINRNGRKLRELVERRNLTIVNNTELCKGLWTRVSETGKSAIDLAICNEAMLMKLQNMEIDEERVNVLTRIKKEKGRYIEIPTDHNTITVTIQSVKEPSLSKEVVWNVSNKVDQKRFTKMTDSINMKEKWNSAKGNINKKYRKWNRQIKSLMYSCFKRVTIKPGKRSKTINSKIREKSIIKKEISILQRMGIKGGIVCNFMKSKLDEKIEEIAVACEKEKAQKTKSRLDKIIEQGHDRRNEIWNIRKNVTRNREVKLAIKSIDGVLLTDEEEISSRYNEYYSDLLKPRSTDPDSSEYVHEMESTFANCMSNTLYDNDQINADFSLEELEKVIKDTKPRKCPGPDENPTEIIIHAGKNLKENILKMVNFWWRNEQLPDELVEADVKTMYKGKGDTRDLKNQRGIFLGNEILKLYEKLINKRIRPKMEENISEWQAGGRPKRSIQDQIFILRSVWNHFSYLNIAVIIEFLDLVKAFDKMILKSVLIDLWNCNIKGRIWRTIYQINKKSRLRIKTPFGKTPLLEIGESLKQGSVLATALAALHTSTVSSMFNNKGLNIKYGDMEINNLLFQDDILRIQRNAEDMNIANKVYEIFQKNNRLEYHDLKSVYMCTKGEASIKLNNKEMNNTKSYKYLGDIFTDNNTYNKMIDTRAATIRGTTAELNAIISEIPESITMKAIISYHHTIILSKLLLNAETWSNLTKKNIADLETVQNSALKRLLRLPITTPSAILRSELGIWSIASQLMYKKLSYLHRLLNLNNNVTKQVLLEQMKLPGPTWVGEVGSILNTLIITKSHEEIKNCSKYKWKNEVKRAIVKLEISMLQKVKDTAKKGQLLALDNIKTKNYLLNLKQSEAATILKIRTGMVNVRDNYKYKYKDLKCQMCKIENETANHFLTCKKYKTDAASNETINSIWGNSIDSTKEMSLAANIAQLRLEEKMDSDGDGVWCQEEEDTSDDAN